MPSSRNRKKNKGKEKKARQEEVKRVEMYNIWRNWALGNMGRVTIQCNHGLVEVPDISHPVSSIMHEFCMPEFSLRASMKQHLDVWDNDEYRSMITNILISIGVYWLLYPDVGMSVEDLASIILIVENYDTTYDYYTTIHCRDVAVKNRDHRSGAISDKRDLLKFFRKRIDCKCLKKMHLEARKSFPKLGYCYNCEIEKERALLMVCSRCRISQYCSKECQVAASSEHRKYCDEYFRKHEVAMAAPKRKSSFILYSDATRDEVKAANPDANFGTLIKIISTNFKALSADERAYWDRKADEDEERYIKEMAAFKATLRGVDKRE